MLENINYLELGKVLGNISWFGKSPDQMKYNARNVFVKGRGGYLTAWIITADSKASSFVRGEGRVSNGLDY